MAFEIERRIRDDVVILAPKGKLIAGEPIETLRATFDTELAAGHHHIVLDLSDCNYIDSSGLGCLVMSHTRVTRAGGKMPIFNLQRRAIELLVLTKLSTVFEIYEDETDAVNATHPDRAPRQFDILAFIQAQKPQEGS